MVAKATIDPDELLNRQFSIRPGLKSAKNQTSVTLGQFLDRIRMGKWKAEIAEIRNASKAEDREKRKQALATAKLSGLFDGLDDKSLHQHSGLLCLDFDHLGRNVGWFRLKLELDPYVLSLFESPSGTGLKVIVPIEATTSDEHQLAFERAHAHFSSELPPGAILDKKPKHVSANCFVSFDPHVWVADSARASFYGQQPCREPQGRDNKDILGAIESNENEPSFFSPSSEQEVIQRGERADKYTNRSDCPLPEGDSVLPFTPPHETSIRFPDFIESYIWPKWAYTKHERGRRNSTIVNKVPILLNLVSPLNAALLMLHWFDKARSGTFRASRGKHWSEVRSLTTGCLRSYAEKNLTDKEESYYQSLKTERQKTAFRICRSLSLLSKNQKPTPRLFFLPAKQLADRLGCNVRIGWECLEKFKKDKVIHQVEAGRRWQKGKGAKPTRYVWCGDKDRSKIVASVSATNEDPF